jgi:hypothetical protein
MKTKKWILGLIMAIGTLVLPVILTYFKNGGHPSVDDWLLIGKVTLGVFFTSLVKPAPDPSPWQTINWTDFWHGLATVAGGFFIGVIAPDLFTHWPTSMDQWWIIISAFVSMFGTYLVTALFTNSKGKVTLS